MMTTATKKQPAASVKADRTLPQRLADERLELLAAAEQLTLELAAGADRTPEAQLVFDSLSWDEKQIQKAISRATNIRESQTRAGTTETRRKAAEALDLAESSLALRGPQIEGEIARLSDELRAMQNAASTARETVRRQQNYLANLRSLAPPHVQAAARQRWQRADAVAVTSDVAYLESQIKITEGLATIEIGDAPDAEWPPPAARERAIQIGRSMDREDDGAARFTFTITQGMRQTWHLRCAVWRQYVTERGGELPDMRAALAKALDAKAAIQAEVDAMLDFYAR